MSNRSGALTIRKGSLQPVRPRNGGWGRNGRSPFTNSRNSGSLPKGVCAKFKSKPKSTDALGFFYTQLALLGEKQLVGKRTKTQPSASLISTTVSVPPVHEDVGWVHP
eukprot:1160751-Pelagomonas_calceolata.AAC.7